MNYAGLPFQPNEVVLVMLVFQRFVFLEVLAVIALLRVILGVGWTRWPALAALLVALTGSVTVFGPALGFNGPIYAAAARWMVKGGGMAPLMLGSGLMFLSMLSPRRRGKWLDLINLLLAAGLAVLWIATMY